MLWVPLRHHNLLQPTGTTMKIDQDILAVLNMFGSTSVNGDIDMEGEENARATTYHFAGLRVAEHVPNTQDIQRE